MAFAAEVPEHLSFSSGAKSSNNQLVTHTASQLTSRLVYASRALFFGAAAAGRISGQI
jgi:hypothetical protein